MTESAAHVDFQFTALDAPALTFTTDTAIKETLRKWNLDESSAYHSFRYDQYLDAADDAAGTAFLLQLFNSAVLKASMKVYTAQRNWCGVTSATSIDATRVAATVTNMGFFDRIVENEEITSEW
jgi:hypothetical protein